ncbi:MAG: hypothetical protein HY901_35125 [Deltaproteobacteria bacterium]|nr:hypothetical protein [Deltaproteobacteria bacterium]
MGRKSAVDVAMLLSLVAIAVAAPAPARAQAVIKVTDDVSLKFGGQVQAWGDLAEDAQGYYTKNLYIRRLRFLMGGQVAKPVTFFLQADVSNLGKPGNKGPGLSILDAFLSYKPFAASESSTLRDALQIDAGLFLVPLCRNALQSTLTFLSLDVAATTLVDNFNGLGLRDTGLQLRGFFFDSHLEYRLAAFQGLRTASGRNPLRLAGYLQYDLFDREKGYAYQGYNYGKSKILALSAGIDAQGSFRALSASLAVALPVREGDELDGLVQYLHYDGGKTLGYVVDPEKKTESGIPVQNDVLVEVAYYIGALQLAPFAKFESQYFVDGNLNQNKGVMYFGGGFKYFVAASNLNFTVAYTRAQPRSSADAAGVARKGLNQVTAQLQMFYF